MPAENPITPSSLYQLLTKYITQQYTLLAIVICILFLFGYAVVGMFGWGNPAPSEQAIGEVSRWCERVADGIFREPSNALSNITDDKLEGIIKSMWKNYGSIFAEYIYLKKLIMRLLFFCKHILESS